MSTPSGGPRDESNGVFGQTEGATHAQYGYGGPPQPNAMYGAPYSAGYGAPGPHNPGYVAPVPPPGRKSVSPGTILSVFLGAVAVLIVGGAIWGAESEKKANFLVVHGDGALFARIDGAERDPLIKKNGTLNDPLVAHVTPGAHTIEIVDAKGTVVETGKFAVPEHGYRALYEVGQSRKGYALVEVGYGETVKNPVTPMTAAEPHVYVLPPDTFLPEDQIKRFDERFPDSVHTKGARTLRRICSLNDDGEPSCL